MILKLLGLFAFLPLELIAAFIRLKVRGEEHIPEGGYILCPTHMGELDPYFIRRALHDSLTFGKRNRYLFRLEFGPWVRLLFLNYWGGWIVERSGPNIKALRGALEWLKQGRPVTVFPEGHQHGRGVVHKGAAFLACRSGRPLLPLVIDRGVFVGEGTPFYIFPFRVLWRYLREAPRVSLTFLEPLRPDPERYRREGRQYLDRLTRELALRLFGRELEIIE
ncbi:MAG: lysophospholipid acyltransferase family protein [Candidatus Bipolaricaulia bacterium]